MNYIGIDIGTSSICGVVYDDSTGENYSVTRENDAVCVSGCNFAAEQDPMRIVTIVTGLIEDLSGRVGKVDGIGFSGQMHGMLYVDENGLAVSALYTWQDMRGNQLLPDGESYVEYLNRTTGLELSTGYGLVTHFYNLRNGLVPVGAKKIVTIMDYVVMRLVERKTPLIDPSNAASLGFFDLRDMNFNTAALEKVGISADILPEIATKITLAGRYRDVPVFTAVGDNQASFIGAVRDYDDSIHVTVGTSSQISVYSEHYRRVDSLDTRPLPGGGYILVGAALCGGYSYAMLKNFFKACIVEFTVTAPSDAEIYSWMNKMASEDEAPDGLVVKTLFDGSRGNPDARGSILQISRDNFTPASIIRGFLKGMSDELYGFYKMLPEDMRRDKSKLIGSGNGIMKNRLLVRTIEQQFGLKMHLSSCSEEAALGACMVARIGLAG